MRYKFEKGSRVVRKKEVTKIIGCKDSFIDRGIADGSFPKPIALGARAVGWPDYVIYDWLNEKAAAAAPETD